VGEKRGNGRQNCAPLVALRVTPFSNVFYGASRRQHTLTRARYWCWNSTQF